MSKEDKVLNMIILICMIIVALLVVFSIVATLIALPFFIHEKDWFGLIQYIITDIIVIAVASGVTYWQISKVE